MDRVSPDDARDLLSAIRGEIRETRDAVMTKIGGLEVAYQHIASEVASTRAAAAHAKEVAAEAKRIAESARSVMLTTEEALKRHVDVVAESAKADREAVASKTDQVLQEIQASRALGQARSQLRLEQEAERAREIETTERRKRHVKWAIGIAVSVAQIVQLYMLVWRSLA